MLKKRINPVNLFFDIEINKINQDSYFHFLKV